MHKISVAILVSLGLGHNFLLRLFQMMLAHVFKGQIHINDSFSRLSKGKECSGNLWWVPYLTKIQSKRKINCQGVLERLYCRQKPLAWAAEGLKVIGQRSVKVRVEI